MSGSPLSPSFGYFGKIPARGDFIQEQLPSDFVSSWSEWLQAILAVSKEQLCDSWLDCYLTSPVWHFALSPGVCGEKAMIGTLMPSVDQVGRHFYFTLAAEAGAKPAWFWTHRQQWSRLTEEQVLQLLDDDTDLDQWVMKVKEMEWLPDEVKPLKPVSIAKGQSGQLMLNGEAELTAIHLLHHAYRGEFERYCFWWTSGSERIAPCTLVTSGLPLVSQFAGMLDGNWEQWGW